MSRYIIKVAPDYLPLSTKEFVRHFRNLFSKESFDHWIVYDDYTKIFGYACRSLFEMCMGYFAKEDLVVATTPLHHTSFRNIIEKFVKPENIHVIGLNDAFNGIGDIPEIEKCDLVVITHLFGQDMDLSKLAAFKKKHNCLILEDRVQGGPLDYDFSHEIVDVAYYSMAMDKRPIALGGGFIHVRNNQSKLIADFKSLIDNLPLESTRKRLKELVKKIPTFLLYNKRPLLFSFISIIKLLNHFNHKISLLSFAKSYRKSNPGFARKGYLVKPSPGLFKSMYENFDRHKLAEEVYDANYDFFIKCLTPETVKTFFPWYTGNSFLTPYNTIVLKEELVDTFLEFLDRNNMVGLPNPTYKIFNHPYKNDAKYKKFNNGLAYLPCIANMTNDEIIYLTNKLKEFYMIHYSNKNKK
ncbi:MAG: hypothetical protein ACTSSH_09790 [Candidatus Heimdallarchaeota archaeon]